MAIELGGLTPLIEVFDMPTSLAFYRDLLGFTLVAQAQPGDDFGWGMLRLGGATLMLNTAYDEGERPPAPDPARHRAHRDTGLFFECADVDGVFVHLRARGVAVAPPAVSGYGMKQLYLHDPDGYLLCFQWPAEADNEDG